MVVLLRSARSAVGTFCKPDRAGADGAAAVVDAYRGVGSDPCRVLDDPGHSGLRCCGADEVEMQDRARQNTDDGLGSRLHVAGVPVLHGPCEQPRVTRFSIASLSFARSSVETNLCCDGSENTTQRSERVP